MSKDGKKEKFFCIANCLPVKGSKLGKSNLKSKSANNENINGDGSFYGSGYFDEARLNHTKQWLQNLSTVASFDPESTLHDSHLETFKLDDDDEVDEKENTICEKINGRSCSSKSNSEIAMNETKDSCDIKQKYAAESKKSATASKHSCSDDSITKVKIEDSSMLSSSITSLIKLGEEHAYTTSANHLRRKRYSRRKLRSEEDDNMEPFKDTAANLDTCSLSSSCISLATELVTLDMDVCKSLGITIVGHSNGQQGDCGIFVGCVRKGGAAAASDRIEPGDLILEVNGIDLERMSNEKALSVLRSELSKGGIVTILLAKYWDMDENKDDDVRHMDGMEPLYEPTGSVYSTIPGSRDGTLNNQRNPLKPLVNENNLSRRRRFDEAAGISSTNLNQMMRPHSNVVPGNHSRYHTPDPYQVLSGSSIQTYPDSGYQEPRQMGSAMNVYPPYINNPLPVPPSTFMHKNGRRPMMGLPEARRPFLGSELIDWIQGNIMGMSGRNDARNYAQTMLDAGYLSGMDKWFHEDGWYAIVSTSNIGSCSKSPFF